MATHAPTPLSGSQEKRVLIATAIASGMGFADMIAVNTALPVIQRELQMDAADALWVAEIYLLFIASLMMMGGALGDRFGRRRILQFGIMGFAVTSVFCAASESSALLIYGRAAQGLAAALIMPSSLALLNACYPPERRGQAIGSWTAISSMMIPLGPLVGGAAVDFLSWQWIFLVNLPLSATSVVLLHRLPTPPYETQSRTPLDIQGIIGITIGLGTLVFGLLEGTRRGFSDSLVVGSLIASAVVLPLTVWIEAKSDKAMVPVWMFRKRIFLFANLQTFLFFAGFQGTMFLLPFFNIQVFGFTALQAGAASLPIPIAMIFLSRPVGRFLDIWGPGWFLAVAPFLAGGGLFWLTRVPVDGTYLHHILPAIILIALGLALFIAPVTTVALNAVGHERSGLASAVNNTVARVAGLLSVAVMGIILTHGFSDWLIADLNTLALNALQLQAITDQVQHLAALVPPETLTDLQSQALRIKLRYAFTNGFADALSVAALFMMLAGLLGILNRHRLVPLPGTDTDS